MKNKFLITAMLLALPAFAEGPLDSLTDGQSGLGKLPTYIKSENLTLQAKERIFTYSGNVEIENGDLKITCDTLQGTYTEKNDINTMTAMHNIVITRGPTLRATCEKAFFDATSNTITLSENPELLQDGSILSADSIVLNIETNQSEAKGNVRVKLVKPSKEDEEK